jgi:hypothetical protein
MLAAIGSMTAALLLTAMGYTPSTSAGPPPPKDNDDFANAVAIPGIPYSNKQDTSSATAEPGEPSPCGEKSATVWYEFTATAAEDGIRLQADTIGSDYDTTVSVYTGDTLASLDLIRCNDDQDVGVQSAVQFTVAAGETYRIQAGGFDGATGNLVINLDVAPPPPPPDQAWTIEAKSLEGGADRLEIDVGTADQEPKIALAFAFTIGFPGCEAEGVFKFHEKDVNEPPLINHEVWGFNFAAKECLKSGVEVVVSLTPFDPSNHVVIKSARFENSQGTTDPADDVFVGPGNPRKLDFGKVQRLSNIFLCTEPGELDFLCNGAFVAVAAGQPILSPDPKCTGFPNFNPPEECPRQEVGAFEFEVRYDEKLIHVEAFAELFEECLQTRGEGFLKVACFTKGKEGFFVPPEALAFLIVTPTADTYSILRANQENGIVTQLINQGCNLADLQGHPIPLGGQNFCDNAAVTIRYLEGDVHADCLINVRDQQQISFRWGSREGQLLYNDRFDLEPSAPELGDGDIDGKDIQTVYGRHGSDCFQPHPAQPPVDPKAKVEPPAG